MKQKRKTEIVGIVVGSLLLLSPLFAYFGYLSGMKRAHVLFTDPHAGKAVAMSAQIDAILYSISAGIAGFVAGVVILICSIIAYRRAARDAGEIK